MLVARRPIRQTLALPGRDTAQYLELAPLPLFLLFPARMGISISRMPTFVHCPRSASAPPQRRTARRHSAPALPAFSCAPAFACARRPALVELGSGGVPRSRCPSRLLLLHAGRTLSRRRPRHQAMETRSRKVIPPRRGDSPSSSHSSSSGDDAGEMMMLLAQILVVWLSLRCLCGGQANHLLP
jgi:hypothetical protein